MPRHGSDDKQGDPLRNLVAGGLAGMGAKTLVAPLDRFKILLQGSHELYRHHSLSSGLMEILRREGVRGFYRGNGAQMLRIFPYAGCQFLAFERFKKLYRDTFGPSSFGSFLAGSSAGLTAVVFTYPLDLLRTRLAYQVDNSLYRGIRHAIAVIYQHEGVYGFYKGIKPSIAGMIPYAGASFFTFDFLKGLFIKLPGFGQENEHGPPTLKVMPSLAAGGLAGAISQTVSYPLDVVRRRMMIEIHHKTERSQYRGIWHALTIIYRTEGVRGLFRGVHINYIREVPQVGVAFALYEQLKVFLGVYRDRS